MDFGDFPHLKRAFGEGYLSDPKGREFQRQLLAGDSWYTQRLREELEECLAFAFTRQRSHKERVKNLRHVEQQEVISEMYNLKVQRFFDGLSYATRKDPELDSGARPDLEISMAGSEYAPLLVEVKTLFDSATDAGIRRRQSTVIAELKEIRLPYAVILTSDDFKISPSELKNWLFEQLQIIERRRQIDPEDDMEEGLYFHDDTTRGTVRVSIYTNPGPNQVEVVAGFHIYPRKFVENRLYSRLEDSARQSSNAVPCLVLLTPGYFTVDEDDLLNALFGTATTQVDLATKEWRWVRQDDGLFSPERNRHISSVGLYEERWSPREAPPDFTLFHNPHAGLPLSPEFFRRAGITQIAEQRGDDGVVRLVEV